MISHRIHLASLAVVALLGSTSCGPGGGGTTADACKNRKAGDLVISEFLADPPGADTGKEYIELYNSTSAAIELKGFTVYVSKADGTAQKTHLIRAGTIGPGAYFTLGDVRDTALPEHIGYSYDSALGALPNSEGLIGLKCGQVALDEVKYTGAAKVGRSRSFDGDRLPDATTNDDELLFCDSTTELAAIPGAFGTPGVANDLCTPNQATQTCNDLAGARLVVPPLPGDLVISEIMADPAGVSDANGEWIELYAKSDVDLNGVTLAVGANEAALSSSDCLSVPAGTYALLARSSDPSINGGLGKVLATYNLNLGNSGGTISLRLGATTLDSTSYKAPASGVALQLDNTKLDAALNDEGMNFCPATGTYGTAGNKGTPGMANRDCPPPLNATQCIDATSGQARNIRVPIVGDLVITEFMANPKAVTDSSGEWIEVLVKRDVDLNGVELANEGTNGAVLTSNTCIQPGAGTYALFARNVDPAVNGGLPDKVTGVFTFDLANSGARSISLRRDGGVLDQITYSTVGDGISSQLDPSLLTPTANDDVASFCLAKANRVYSVAADGGVLDGGDRGTPGAANDPCQ